MLTEAEIRKIELATLYGLRLTISESGKEDYKRKKSCSFWTRSHW